jgi:hypothetical protein
MSTETTTPDQILMKLSDKGRSVQEHSVIAILCKNRWFVGRVTRSAGSDGGLGLIGNKDSGGFIHLYQAEKLLILD